MIKKIISSFLIIFFPVFLIAQTQTTKQNQYTQNSQKSGGIQPYVKGKNIFAKLLLQTDTDVKVNVNGKNRANASSRFEHINEIPVEPGINEFIFTSVNDSSVVKKVSFNFDKRENKKYYLKLVKEIQVKEIDMILVEGGSFKMGSRDGNGDEKPLHTVTVGSFYISKYEITQAHWFSVMGLKHASYNGCEDCPVDGVNWNDAQNFIATINKETDKNYRLPTEAEWEFAARGGIHSKNYKYAGSDSLDLVAWYDENSGGKKHKVGEKLPNELGLYDMNGNVWEWCSDWYGELFYARSPRMNPLGPSFGTDRILRGGGWRDYKRRLRPTYRGYHLPFNRSNGDGFRLVIPAD